MKTETKRMVYFAAGLALGGVATVPLHEFGHGIVDYLQGGNPSFSINELGNAQTNATSYNSGNLGKELNVTAGGPLANYVSGVGLAAISKKVKNQYTREFLAGASLSQAIAPFAQALTEFGAHYLNYRATVDGGDFDFISSHTGIPYALIIPATGLALIGINKYLQSSDGRNTENKNKPETDEKNQSFAEKIYQKIAKRAKR